MSKTLDITDPDILRMVLQNHEPEEEWGFSGLEVVRCRTCGNDWPCQTIVIAREAVSRPRDPGRKTRTST